MYDHVVCWGVDPREVTGGLSRGRPRDRYWRRWGVPWLCGAALLWGGWLLPCRAAVYADGQQASPQDGPQANQQQDPQPDQQPDDQPDQQLDQQPAGQQSAGQQSAGQQSDGQQLLDRAVRQKLTAGNMADLERVIELCEKALAQGLDDENQKFAKSLLSSTAYEHGSRIAEAIFGQTPPNPKWPLWRQISLRDLARTLEQDPQHGEAQLLVARLQSLPQGDREQGRKAAEAAVRLLAEDPRLHAQALVLRPA